MTTLEARGFVASDSDITAIATTILSAAESGNTGQRNYLKTLIATTQKALGVEPRLRAGKPAKLDEAATLVQLKALQEVHERFYGIVVKVAGEAVPAGTKDRGIAINRLSNFARTALSAVRSWVRAGHDITSIAAKTSTKASLAVKAATPRAPSPVALKSRAERESKGLVATLMALADADRGAAVTEMQLIVGQLADQMAAMGIKPTRDLDQATAHGLPFRSKSTIFIPTETQIVRQQSRPS